MNYCIALKHRTMCLSSSTPWRSFSEHIFKTTACGAVSVLALDPSFGVKEQTAQMWLSSTTHAKAPWRFSPTCSCFQSRHKTWKRWTENVDKRKCKHSGHAQRSCTRAWRLKSIPVKGQEYGGGGGVENWVQIGEEAQWKLTFAIKGA